MEIAELPQNKKIILFDGVCNLCNSSVLFIIKYDKKDVFRFVSLQSELGQKIIIYIGIDTKNIDSIILYEAGIAYNYKAAAVFKIAKNLGGISSLITLFSILPISFCNFSYDFIAKNRYKWFGKKDFCMIPTNDLKVKFLN